MGDGESKAHRLLGLGVRARTVVTGVEQVRASVMGGRAALVLVADDASRHSRDKLVPLLTARRVPFVGGVTMEWLGTAVGKETTAAVAVVDAALARGIRDAMELPRHANGGLG